MKYPLVQDKSIIKTERVSLKSIFKTRTEPLGVNFLQKVSLRSIFKTRTEPLGVNFLQKVSLRSIFKARTETCGVNFLHKIVCPRRSKQTPQ